MFNVTLKGANRKDNNIHVILLVHIYNNRVICDIFHDLSTEYSGGL